RDDLVTGVQTCALPIFAAPGAVTREHAVASSPGGVVSITGGKLTTYRVMAADVVRVVVKRLGAAPRPASAAQGPLPGGDIASLRSEERRVGEECRGQCW